MDMIERVAKAINDVYEPGYYNPQKLARAAIEAMREPSEDMVGQCMDTGHTRDDAEAVWNKMIDAALECSTKPDGQ